MNESDVDVALVSPVYAHEPKRIGRRSEPRREIQRPQLAVLLSRHPVKPTSQDAQRVRKGWSDVRGCNVSSSCAGAEPFCSSGPISACQRT
jgi:hypothetical protein